MAGFSPVGSPPVGSIGSDDNSFYPQPGSVIFRGGNVTTNQIFISAGHLTFLGAMPLAVFAAPRVTWMGLEAAHTGDAQRRVTWLGVEVLRSTASLPTQWVVSWMGLEITHTGNAQLRVTWMGLEVAHIGAAASRVTWMGLEVLRSVADRQADTGWVCLITG